MAGHVRREDDPDESLSEGLVVVAGEVFEEIEIVLIKNCEGLGSVIILLHRFVAVADCAVRNQVHVVGVGETIVAEVVADC